ncbi:MAG: phosphoribosylformylglycinamidine cyclo-ligase, partial [Christensenellaceae bacterium]
LATGKLVPEKAAQIVKGVAEGCRQAGCALIGGETAEMPGFYPEGEYDLAGFAVGLVDRPKIVDGHGIKPGDALVGLASTGVHSNGFSLVRRLVGEDYAKLSAHSDELGGSLGETLLTPTQIYVKTILELIKQYSIKGMAHITGGGFIENIPRMLPEGCGAAIRLGSWEMPPVFPMLTRLGSLDTRSAYNTFNMGIGMVLAVPAGEAEAVAAAAQALGQPAFVIGEVVEGSREVELR